VNAPLAVAVFVAAFFVGSIPFGYLVGRMFYRRDIRTQGSGNIGAMNALRTLGKGGAIAVLLLDACKGFVPAWWTLAASVPQADIYYGTWSSRCGNPHAYPPIWSAILTQR